MQASRRAFLRVRSPNRTNPMRPPWAVAAEVFLDRCTRCSDCITACPTGLLIKGEGGFPEADFAPARGSEGCTFCRRCLTACTPAALLEVPGQAPWQLKAVFGEACLASQQVVCRTCGDLCDARAIRFSPRPGGVALPQLEHAACTGCGACLAACPTRAIRMSSPSSLPLVLQGAA